MSAMTESDAKPEAPHDAVNHPRHYTTHPSGVECIQVTEHMAFNLGNAVKYIWRAGLKSADPITCGARRPRWRSAGREKKKCIEVQMNL